MEKLEFFGIGPKVGRVVLPWLAVTIALTILIPGWSRFPEIMRQPFLIAGVVLLTVALVFYFSTLRLMLPGIRENRLITRGAYRLCRNPLYAAIILFLFPGLALVLNSWIILTTSVAGYFMVRKFVHKEEELLERIFGDEFRNYRACTPRFFPKLF